MEIEEVVNKLMEGILTNQKMIFVPSNLRIALFFEKLLPERAVGVLRKMDSVKFDAVIRNKQ